MQNFKYRALVLIILCSLTACAETPLNITPLAAIRSEPVLSKTPKSVYRIGAGDELEIKFFFAPELNDRMFVRPDGKISIMFAQDIQASGLTAEELANDVRTVLAPHVKQLDLVVIVRSFSSQRAYVGGEVFKPGPVPLSGNENVLQILSSVGWMTPAAGPDKVVVVRRDANGEEKIYPVNVTELQRGVNMAQNVAMQAGDLVLVPPSDVVFADRWIDQNIRQLLPFTTNAGVAYNFNKTATQ